MLEKGKTFQIWLMRENWLENKTKNKQPMVLEGMSMFWLYKQWKDNDHGLEWIQRPLSSWISVRWSRSLSQGRSVRVWEQIKLPSSGRRMPGAWNYPFLEFPQFNPFFFSFTLFHVSSPRIPKRVLSCYLVRGEQETELKVAPTSCVFSNPNVSPPSGRLFQSREESLLGLHCSSSKNCKLAVTAFEWFL